MMKTVATTTNLKNIIFKGAVFPPLFLCLSLYLALSLFKATVCGSV